MANCWVILLIFALGWHARTVVDWLKLPKSIRKHISVTSKALHCMALTDTLTGLPNRFMLEQSAKAIVRRSRRQGKITAAIFLDLDGFKAVNDRLGHAAGDIVLKECAKRFKARLRSTDLIARWGGDEFLVLLGGLDCVTDANRVAQDLLATLESPIWVSHKSIRISCSFGVAVRNRNNLDITSLLEESDKAMYRCKQKTARKSNHKIHFSLAV